MKSVSWVFILVMLALIACQPGAQEEQAAEPEETSAATILGTWKLSAVQPQDSNAMVAPGFNMYKIFTEDHYFLIRFSGAEDHAFQMALGGTWVETDEGFIEQIGYYSGDSTFVGSEIPYVVELSENTYHQSGTIDNPDEAGADYIIEETYERVEAPLSESGGQNEMVGLWKLDKAYYGEDHEAGAEALPEGYVMYKLITEGHFYVTQYHPENGHFESVVFGSYDMSDGQYVETIITNTMDSTANGMVIPIDTELEGDRLHTVAIMEGGPWDGQKIEEYLTRVE